MLSESYLVAGLNALSRSFTKPQWSWEDFMNGHRGAAMVSSYCLLHDRLVEPESAQPIQAMLDREWAGRPIFAPMPAEPAVPGELDRLLEALGSVFGTATHIGHDVIYPTFALRAFRLLPETITTARIAGLCTMAAAYTPKEPLRLELADAPFDPAAYGAWVLESFLRCLATDPSPGVSGHLLTFGHAVVDLHALGYTELARKAEVGHRAFVSGILGKPADTAAEPTVKPAWMSHLPHQAGHWREQPADCLEKSFGHAPKYAYAMNGFCARVRDHHLVARAREQYHQVYGGRSKPPP